MPDDSVVMLSPTYRKHFISDLIPFCGTSIFCVSQDFVEFYETIQFRNEFRQFVHRKRKILIPNYDLMFEILVKGFISKVKSYPVYMSLINYKL